jgi:hypothetical protein
MDKTGQWHDIEPRKFVPQRTIVQMIEIGCFKKW